MTRKAPGMLRQADAMKRLKEVETLSRPGN